MSFYAENELANLGLASVGRNVLISRNATIYGATRIHVGSHVRIDDFCVLSAGEGGIHLGSHIHIAVFCSLMGQARIEMQDFSGLSSRVAIYSSSDDFSGRALTNPTISPDFTNVISRPVTLEKHVIVGAGSVILPGVTLAEGCAVGALSVIRKNGLAFTIYSGNPARKIAARSRELKIHEQAFLQKLAETGGSNS